MSRFSYLALPTFLLAMAAAAPTPRPQAPVMRLASFHPGPVSCGADEAVALRAPAPLPTASLARSGNPIHFGFRIGPNGRPLGIHQLGDPADPALDIRDLAPALSAWHFEPGGARGDCEIAFTVRLASVDEADDVLLYRYAALGRMQIPGSGGDALLGQTFDRLRPRGSTCRSDPAPLEPINLRFQSIPEIPGGLSYSFYSYDVDEQGRPVHVRLLNSSGNRTLDMAGDIAIGGARFPAQPRVGCLYYFYRFSTDAIPAPTAPPSDLYPQGPACDALASRQVASRIRMEFPPEFLRRRAEGWVVFAYDVETPGMLSNVRILASEPAARFGEEVSRAATEVRVSGLRDAQRGCVQRVRFQLPRS
jgi:hypothetical protein